MLFCFAILAGCANIVAPQGGPIDTTPPQFIKSTPPNHSTNFKEEKVRIYFDEFVALKDAMSQIVISPQIENTPEFRLKGKSLIIEFKDKFKDSTTYNIFFGNSIVNITESKPMVNFQYVFSTGDYVDSLVIKGNVKNSYDLKAEEDVIVMLYKETGDSVPYQQKPFYISKTDKSGNFQLNNLADGKYKLFALKDANSNYLYDLPNEQIAFIDSLVVPYIIYSQAIDSVSADTVMFDSSLVKTPVADSSLVDSLAAAKFLNKSLKLFLFEEKDSTQQIISAKAPKLGRLLFIFKYPVKDLSIRRLKEDSLKDWKIDEFLTNRDTLICWLKNLEQDSLFLEISDKKIVLDTVKLALITKEKEQGKKGKKEELVESLQINPNASNKGKFDYFSSLNLSFSFPVDSFDFSNIILREKTDTVFETIAFEIKFENQDVKRKILISNKFKEASSYNLFIPSGAFTDIHGLKNDTLDLNFTTSETGDYGIIFLDLKLPGINENYIIQLLTENDLLIKQVLAKSTQKLEFNHLKPGKYKFKAIHDTNKNGHWDTGDYMKKLQAERVFYVPEIIKVRANWDQDIEWDLR